MSASTLHCDQHPSVTISPSAPGAAGSLTTPHSRESYPTSPSCTPGTGAFGAECLSGGRGLHATPSPRSTALPEQSRNTSTTNPPLPPVNAARPTTCKSELIRTSPPGFSIVRLGPSQRIAPG